MKRLWDCITQHQVVTWFCHAAISCSVAAAFIPLGLWWVSKALWGMALLYLGKEIWDLFKHARELDRDMDPDGITPRTDFFGDLAGPLTAAITGQLCLWASL